MAALDMFKTMASKPWSSYLLLLTLLFLVNLGGRSFSGSLSTTVNWMRILVLSLIKFILEIVPVSLEIVPISLRIIKFSIKTVPVNLPMVKFSIG